MRKKILITAGPTWVPIDSVRVISNISSGETGLILSNEAVRRGYDVTLFLGPVGDVSLNRKIRVIRYFYFNDLKQILENVLKRNKFDTIIHAAAISDYEPIEKNKNKIPSNLKYLSLKLRKTPKLIPLIRKLSPKSFFVIFKLEDKVNNFYVNKAKRLMLGYCANLAILNSINPYRARIIDRKKAYSLVKTKKSLSKRLFSLVKQEKVR